MKTKQEYAEIYNRKMDELYYEGRTRNPEDPGYWATEEFELVCNADEVVGYYVALHGDSALEDWLANTDGVELSDQSKEVDRILKELYSK